MYTEIVLFIRLSTHLCELLHGWCCWIEKSEQCTSLHGNVENFSE